MGRTPTQLDSDQYTEQETQQRFEQLVRRALNTRPKPLKTMAKGMPSQSKKKGKRRGQRKQRAA
jgi:hypothetical protein